MLSIAVTGGIASGKSLFGKILSSFGADVIDADAVVHKLYLPGGKGAQSVAKTFGRSFLHEDGSTNRVQLAKLVFSDDEARTRLDALLHPMVREELKLWNAQQATSPIKINQIPLLFESGWESDFDQTITIESPWEIRLERLQTTRGLTLEQSKQRLNAQLSKEQRILKANHVVWNNASVVELEQVARTFMDYLENSVK